MEDLIIRGGLVADGTGAPLRAADVAVRGEVITEIGDLRSVRARQTLNAEGLVVSPGFIDAHSHADTSFLKDASCASKLSQGITTEITGNCGDSPFPFPREEITGDTWRCASFDRFVRRFEAGYSMATNQALLVGHGTLRAAVMGYENRPAMEEEIREMAALLHRDLSDGAWGLSLGLEYAPGFFADARELTALGRVVREFDGFLPAHMRSEGLAIDAALEELLSIGRESGARVHVSHIKLDNPAAHGRAAAVWAALEKARAEGVRVSADVYPYAASCTALSIRCPSWSLEGGDEALCARLQSPQRAAIVEGIRRHYFNAQRADTCLFSDDGGLFPALIGKTLRQAAEELLHTQDYAEAAADILIRTRGRAWCVFFVMDEADVLYFLGRDTAIGTDSAALPGDIARLSQRPHPRAFGALPEFFRLNRLHGFCSLESAVSRVTLRPARLLGLRRRGCLRPGFQADITVFSPDEIAPRATYAQPVQLSRGIAHVLVNGGVAMKDGKQTDFRGGRFLRKGRDGEN